MNRFLISLASTLLPVAAFAAGDITVTDAYVRSSSPKSAAAFMQIANSGAADCQLVAVESSAAGKTELHTHLEEDGMMKMVKVEEGFTIPAGGHFDLQRGGAHIMMTSIETPLSQGQDVVFKMNFEGCDQVEITTTVDNDRPAAPEHHGH